MRNTKPMRLHCAQVNSLKAQDIALHGDEAAVDGGSSLGNASEAESVDGDAHGSCSGM